MERLRRRWWVVLAVSVALGVAIFLLAPHYTEVQTAADAVAFRLAVAEDGRGSTVAAGLVDLAFAASYALLALALTRRHVATRLGAALVAAGAAGDLVENTLLLVGVGRREELDDGAVDLMRAFGAVKWAGITAGWLVLAFGLLRDRRPPSA
jgi:hypothetical protein